VEQGRVPRDVVEDEHALRREEERVRFGLSSRGKPGEIVDPPRGAEPDRSDEPAGERQTRSRGLEAGCRR
jgi:hypothetical protein